MKRVKKAIIPAAGLGKRFLPVTRVLPKELLPVGSRPAMEYVVEEVFASGIEEIIIVNHPSKRALSDYFRGDRFRFVYQEERKGVGDAVWCARELVGEQDFLLIYPDALVFHTVPAAQQLITACRELQRWGVLLRRVPRSEICHHGIIGGKKMGNGLYQIDKTVEKPTVDTAPSEFSIFGRCLLPAEIFSLIGKTGKGALGEVQLTDALNLLAQERPGIGVECQGTLFDVGVPEGLVKASSYVLKSGGRETSSDSR